MAHAQKPDLVFQRNGRVHLYRRGCQFSRLLAAEVCASAVVMLERPCSHTVHECWLPTPFASFPFTSPPVLRRVPSDSMSTLPICEYLFYRRWGQVAQKRWKVSIYTASNRVSATLTARQSISYILRDRQCTYNVTLRRVRAATVAVEKQ